MSRVNCSSVSNTASRSLEASKTERKGKESRRDDGEGMGWRRGEEDGGRRKEERARETERREEAGSEKTLCRLGAAGHWTRSPFPEPLLFFFSFFSSSLSAGFVPRLSSGSLTATRLVDLEYFLFCSSSLHLRLGSDLTYPVERLALQRSPGLVSAGRLLRGCYE